MSRTAPKLVLMMAMQAEAEPIIQRLDLKPAQPLWDQCLPMICHQGELDSAPIVVVTSGKDPRYGVDYIGTEAATLASHLAIEYLHPDCLLNAGTAGGFASLGADIGRVYLGSGEYYFHDHRVPLPGFDAAVRGRYPAAIPDQLAARLGLSIGPISTGSSLLENPDDLIEIRRQGAVAKDMEAAAIAWVAWLYKTPFVAIKAITNLLDSGPSSATQFQHNLDHASLALAQQTIELLGLLACGTVPIPALSPAK